MIWKTEWVFATAVFLLIIFAHPKKFLSSDDIGNSAIFTCAGITFALIWHNTSVFVFDLHSRNRNGHHISNFKFSYNFVQ